MRSNIDYALGKLVSEPLQSLLRPGEVIQHVTTGRVNRRAGLAKSGWTVMVTTQRLLCVRDEGSGRLLRECERTHLRSVRAVQGWFSNSMIAETDVERIIIDDLSGASAAALAAALLRDAAQETTSALAPGALITGTALSQSSHEALLDRIERLEAEMEELRHQIQFLEALPARNLQSAAR